jgi:alpha-ketoglutarate-dependent taurine dioxygenase
VVDESRNGLRYGFVSNVLPNSATPPEALLPWHSDYAWTPRPDCCLSLYGLRISDDLASTVFADAVRGASALPSHLRARVENARGLMLVDLSQYGEAEPSSVVPTIDAEGNAQWPRDEYNYPRIWHPMLYRHPRTGEDLLHVQEWYSVLVEGLSYDESQALQRELFEVLYDPAHLYSHAWREGDLIVWDNLALHHGRPKLRSSAGGERTLRRVVIHDGYDEVMAFTSRVGDLADAG